MYPFVECTTLADDMKYNGWSWQSDWHYDDIPFLDEGGSISDYPKYVFNVNNITLDIESMIDWLKGKSGY